MNFRKKKHFLKYFNDVVCVRKKQKNYKQHLSSLANTH